MLRGHGTANNYYKTLPERERDDRRTAFMMKFLGNDIKEFARTELRSSLPGI